MMKRFLVSTGILPVSTVRLVDRTVNSSALENAADGDTHSCVTLHGTKPTINILFTLPDRYAKIRTVVTYIPDHESSTYGADGSPMKISVGSSSFSVSHTFTAGTNNAYVWSGTGSGWVRIELKNQGSQTSQTLTTCEVKVYDVTLETNCTCDDDCSRNQGIICGGVCRETPTQCPRENVALGTPATMSSRYKMSGDASLAVNGNTGTTLSGPGFTSDTTQWNCIQTDDKDDTPYWEVDLGQNYNVKYITIFRRGGETGRNRMAGTEVTVDGKVCKRLTRADYQNERIDLTCTTPLTGRHVRLSRHGPYGADGPSINLCELQVWVCNPGRYGFECQETCSSHCRGGNSNCDFYGTCTNGCEAGWYLPKCTSKCGHCKSTSCDQFSGQCSPCQDNWSGAKCTECDNTHYGPDCGETCGHCGGKQRCNPSNGVCSTGCAPGWRPDDKCKQQCEAGKYGSGCSETCSAGCENTCDRRDGQCKCRAGWDPSDRLCKTKCPKGSYGDNCNMTCGYCAGSSACEHDTGHCTQGCVGGFTGDNCHDVAPLSSGGLEIWHIVTIVFAGLTVIALTIVATFCVTR
ncbi:hypothetical protein BaRGS_00026848 [Batillaria attramentaria]|uniref:Laminin EGF-like domain-containing protein n=1 Tax=Batillaria attramentaria TaxID=370345 RepID=A0ABD0K3G3_9CAEN